MNKPTALQLLLSSSAHERLVGARFLARHASVEDQGYIDQALARENVFWVRNALSLALKRAIGAATNTSEGLLQAADQNPIQPDQQAQEIYSNALQETTSLLLHEIEPLVGTARLYAKREIPHFDESKTKKQFELLDTLLAAISDLRTASGPAKPIEIDLSGLIREVRERETQNHGGDVQLAGPSSFNVIADRGRLLLAIANGLRNALEATRSVEETGRRSIVINWNRTDQDYWISIIDHGIGLKASLERIFDIGSSSKKGHLGMGLAIARQAVMSMGGDITISPRDESGVTFEIRWPRYSPP
jgi:signal transduction histidine kinase